MKIYYGIFFVISTFFSGGYGMSTNKLKVYRARRELTKNKRAPEPYGKIKKTKTKELLFVIQKHEASHLHYDFRLEIDGVLASWAVPKGLPEENEVKRLAVPTDDHPMEYAEFEGIIPQGQYGGGTVMVWDIGTYENLKENQSMEEAKKSGTIEVFLKGKKIWGAFALVRMHSFGPRENWIVMKLKKQIKAKRPAKKVKIRKDVSALTQRTMKQIAKAQDAIWESNR